MQAHGCVLNMADIATNAGLTSVPVTKMQKDRLLLRYKQIRLFHLSPIYEVDPLPYSLICPRKCFLVWY